jgi:hypothetical protein
MLVKWPSKFTWFWLFPDWKSKLLPQPASNCRHQWLTSTPHIDKTELCSFRRLESTTQLDCYSQYITNGFKCQAVISRSLLLHAVGGVVDTDQHLHYAKQWYYLSSCNGIRAFCRLNASKRANQLFARHPKLNNEGLDAGKRLGCENFYGYFAYVWKPSDS